MTRVLGTLLAICLGVAACGVGDDSVTQPGDDQESHIQCTAQLSITGSFTASGAIDPTGGCQPAGTWTFTVAVANQGTCSNVPLKSSYVYEVVGTGMITYQGASSGEDLSLNINATGNGGCEGSFEHILADGSNFDQLALHPRTPEPVDTSTTLAIAGQGDYDLWDKHP